MGKALYKRLGDYIHEIDNRNTTGSVKELRGISMNKQFREPTSNLIGVETYNYKVVSHNVFAFDSINTIRVNRVPIALNTTNEDIIISPAYTTLIVNDESTLIPEFLYMWCLRSEFDREGVYNAVMGVRGSIALDDFFNFKIKIPDISIQTDFVQKFKSIELRLNTIKGIQDKLDHFINVLYQKYFEEGLNQERIPQGWRLGKLSDIATYNLERVECNSLTIDNYISTDNMLKNLGGVIQAVKVPDGKAINFRHGDILLSNIRPYFKKMWQATFQGGCSADVLCLRPISPYTTEFVYSSIAKDGFFDYVMAGSNGVKMPRGDKKWIMDYPVAIPPSSVLKQYDMCVRKIYSYKNLLTEESIQLDSLKNYLLIKISQL